MIESRLCLSKHFLKKKVKAAFEREPIDKNKSFFNIPFLPTLNMFVAPPQQQQNIPSSTPNQIRNNSNINPNLNNQQQMNKLDPRNQNILMSKFNFL